MSYTLKLISSEKTRAGEARRRLASQIAEITSRAEPALGLSASGVTMI